MKKSNVDVENSPEANGPEAPEPLVPAEHAPLTDEVADLKDRAAKADEHWQRLLRTTADFENFKKRATREKQDSIKFANESLLQKLIPILDNFDMALSAAQHAQTDAVQSLQTGVNMIHQLLKSAMTDAGLEEISAVGKTFAP